MADQFPRWNVSNIYPGLDSQEFKQAWKDMLAQIESLDQFFDGMIAPADIEKGAGALAFLVGEWIERFNAVSDLAGSIHAYIVSFVATDAFDRPARRMESEYEAAAVRLQQLNVRASAWIGRIAPLLPGMIAAEPRVQSHAFFLEETARQSRYLMSEAEESLSAELMLDGASAWSRLHGALTSQLTWEFTLDGKTEKMPMPALVNLRSHPEEPIRRRAYEAELAAWKSLEEPLAAALNGIKGAVNTLDRRRGRRDALHSAMDAARMDRPTLDVLLSAMRDSLPIFHRYFQSKAQKLGKDRLAWWDLFAPLGQTSSTFTWEQARGFILGNFASFSPELESLARRAFDHDWIDAATRPGKRGGAFCMGIPAVRESRILCNFDGSLDQVLSVAHELGHAFHNECAFAAGKTLLQRDTPTTLAETASIFCETLVSQAALEQAASPEEELAVLEGLLNNASQLIVDVYSAYLFEKEVFERRLQAELSAEELCGIMEQAQKDTYGDGLDERFLMKYVWVRRRHFYSAERSFHNFPYSFGLLFGLGLYAVYRQKGADFVPDFIRLLADTGEAFPADLAARFGIDIRARKFWDDSLAVIGEQMEHYVALGKQR